MESLPNLHARTWSYIEGLRQSEPWLAKLCTDELDAALGRIKRDNTPTNQWALGKTCRLILENPHQFLPNGEVETILSKLNSNEARTEVQQPPDLRNRRRSIPAGHAGHGKQIDTIEHGPLDSPVRADRHLPDHGHRHTQR